MDNPAWRRTDDEPRTGFSRPRPKGLLAIAALASIPLLLAACGDDNDGKEVVKAPNQQAGKSVYEQALAYAKCMRASGDPAWPDPGSNGAFPNENGSLDRTSAAYKKAAAACKHLEVAAGGPPAAQVEKQFTQLLKYSKCMRGHGVPAFPDPTKDGGGVGITLTKDIDPNSAAFKSAQNACKSLQPEG